MLYTNVNETFWVISTPCFTMVTPIILFTNYSLSLLLHVIMSNACRYIDDQCINHLMYADNICLVTSTIIAIQ